MSCSRPLSSTEGMTSLRVDNLAYCTSSMTLKHVFEDFGPVDDVYIPRNHLTEEPYGLAFIRFHNKCDAKNAVDTLNGILLDGSKLRVQMVWNYDLQCVHPECGQGGRCHYKEDNHESQTHSERHCCPTTRIQSTSRTSSPVHSESQSQSGSSHQRSSSSRRSKSKSSLSSNQLQDRSCPRSRSLPQAKQKKSKSSSSCKYASENPEEGGIWSKILLSEECSLKKEVHKILAPFEAPMTMYAPISYLKHGKNTKNKQTQTKNSESELIFGWPYVSKENRSETPIASPVTKSHTTSRNPDLLKEGTWDERHDLESNQRQAENPQSDSKFSKTYTSQGCTTKATISVAPTRVWTRSAWIESEEDQLHDMFGSDVTSYEPITFEQCGVMAKEEQREYESWTGTSLNNSHSHNFMDIEHANDNCENSAIKHDHLYFARLLGEENMETNQRQMGKTQSKSMLNASHRSKGNATDTLMTVPCTRSQTRKRCRMQQNSMESGNNTFMVAPCGDSEGGLINSFKPSENNTEKEIVECGVWTTKNQSKPNNNGVSGEMQFTFMNENSNPQNPHVLVSRLSCHDSNRNRQRQVDYQQPESTCIIPFTPEEDITELLIDDQFTTDRSIRSESPEGLLVGEMIESRQPPYNQNVASMEVNSCVSLENIQHLKMHNPYFISSIQPLFPFNDDVTELPRRHSFTSSPIRGQTLKESTAYRCQSTSVTPTNTVETNHEEHTNISSHSIQSGMQNSEVISMDQTSNLGLDFIVATAPYERAEQSMTGVFEVDNFIEIDLEASNSPSSQNHRPYSGDSSISSSISSSTSNFNTHPTFLSLSSLSEHFLPSLRSEASTVNNRNSSAVLQINEDTDAAIMSPYPLFEFSQGRQVTTPELSDDSDSWPSLPDFTNFNDIHNNHPRGLTREQINTLPIRDFCENDKLNSCSICITEYIESSMIRTLPCFHEYHDKCIDFWLSDNSTCPICRRKIIHCDDLEFFI